MSRIPVAVLVSGSGSNLQALLDACAQPDHPARIAVVLCNRPRARAIQRAERAGVPVVVLPHRRYDGRQAYDQALVDALAPFAPAWVACAGFMRVLGPTFVRAYAGRILNIHPSLLPSFPGLHAHQQAIDAGGRVSGCTVHLVDEGVDTGPILAQAVVPVLAHDTADSLGARVLKMEHRVYPEVLRWAARGRIQSDGTVTPTPTQAWGVEEV